MFTNKMIVRIAWLQEQVKDKYPDDLILNHLITCTQVSKEVSEVLDCLPWKFERKMETVSREHLLEELVDVFRFYVRLLIIHNVTEKEFQEAFDSKSEIVERRLCNGKSMEECLREEISRKTADNN
ncbi:unnamed protein product [marine sediment metagenome]|uniref:NTP pyrophosphohydrolase MazG putative catalytic core domain-containing protein n=1 Tax=marine sediment metagenome TaxID=412755 RepID=X0SIW9_9ZZZZ